MLAGRIRSMFCSSFLSRPIWLVPLVLCALAVGCQQPSDAVRTSSPATSSQFSTTHDLSQDEAAGGHTLKKHVGRTDDQLRERLNHERNISAASTYTDRQTAEQVVGTALQQNREKISRWAEREGGHPNLVLDFNGDDAHPVGRSLRRGDDQTQPCSHAVVVLRWVSASEYYVLTTYPECR
jgi:toxin YxiD